MLTPTFAAIPRVRRSLGVIVAASVLPILLAACAPMAAIPPGVDTKSVRPIAVTVNTDGPGIAIMISEEPIVVPSGDTRDLQWFISGSGGWKLDAITVSNPGSDLQDLGGDDNSRKWQNRHQRAGDYKYAIQLKRGNERLVVDPTIKNQ